MVTRSNMPRSTLMALLVLGCATCPQAPPVGASALASAPTTTQPTANDGAPHAVVRRQNYRIERAPIAVEVDPNDGGRIVEFSLDGRSVIVPVTESPEAYASS